MIRAHRVDIACLRRALVIVGLLYCAADQIGKLAISMRVWLIKRRLIKLEREMGH